MRFYNTALYCPASELELDENKCPLVHCLVLQGGTLNYLDLKNLLPQLILGFGTLNIQAVKSYISLFRLFVNLIYFTKTYFIRRRGMCLLGNIISKHSLLLKKERIG